MSAAAFLRFKQLRLIMDSIVHTLTEFSRTDSHNSSRQQVQQLQAHHRTMSAAFQLEGPNPAWHDVEPEYLLFLTSFTSCMTLLTARLDMLNRATLTPLGIAHFCGTWCVLTVACGASLRWASISPGAINPAHLPHLYKLHLALMRLMECMLAAPRNGSRAWRALVGWESEEVTVKSLVLVLSVPLNCIRRIIGAPPRFAARELAALPAGFLPLLCCVTCEHLSIPSPTPTITPATTVISASGQPPSSRDADLMSREARPPGSVHGYAFLGLLASLVGDIIHDVPLDKPLRDMVSCPAAIQLLKLVVVIKAWEGTLHEPRRHLCTVSNLISLVNHRYELDATQKDTGMGRTQGGDVAEHCSSNSAGGCSSSGNSGSSGSSSVVTQGGLDLIPRQYFQDAQLMRILSLSVCKDVQSSSKHLLLMTVLLRGQTQGASAHDAPHTVVALCASLLTLGRHCSSQAMLWMQSFQDKAQRQRHTRGLKLTQLQQGKQRSLDTSDAMEVLFGEDLPMSLRVLMTQIGSSTLWMTRDVLALGECEFKRKGLLQLHLSCSL